MKRVLISICFMLVFLTAGIAQSSKKYIEQGNLLFEQGQYDKAVIKYENAIWLRSDLAEPYYRKGHAHARLNQHFPALEAYTFALMRDSMCTEALLGRYTVYSKLGMRDMAIADSTRLVLIASRPPQETSLLFKEMDTNTVASQVPYHLMAGNKLIDFRKQYYAGFVTGCVGAGVVAIGAAIAVTNPVGWVILGVGGVTTIVGGVITLVSISKVGEAGEYLKLVEMPKVN
jgi:hypothetical protein